MTVPSAEELDSFKYSDLQNLAKRLGLRANLRADKLLRTLKAHLNAETRKENLNQDENQSSASSCDETEILINRKEQAGREPAAHATKTRRKRKTVHGIPDFQDDSEMKGSDPTTLQNQGKQENQDLRTTTKVPSLPDQSQQDGSAASSGKCGVDDNKDSKRPLGKRSLSMDGSSKLGNNKRTAASTPNFKRLHEAHFKKMESIDEYIVRKKKHLNEHNSLNELTLEKKGLVTPVPARGRLSVPCTPARQQFSQDQSHGPESQGTICLKGSDKHSVLSATKMNVRFSAATKDNEHKCSLTKTPARKSPHVTLPGSAAKGQAVFRTPKLTTTERAFLKTTPAVITPFKLTTGATQTPGSSKKPVFDLKASLSRPLNYKPHKGKLKPWGQSKENSSLKEGVSRVSIHRKTYKQPHLRTREEQRKKHEQERKERKAKVLEARRNLVMTKAQ
ncbi:nucleolar and spindle-associated protein 1 isoform X2 [Cricetulus griseus]|uniref:Nucleolar and spindle-associated protein 1 isoform X2 n=1 Tax=Cricetulus griseus TaxID=10029 RepID=A0A9J7G750_CRIGR|nr:nucleolar and spindle-associated protein 1 isoform X2 [Cricetulus griseus]XP_027277960.1 nucleolar and spindle-associated protein 1 isoform X2 [Cricetulus griseus]